MSDSTEWVERAVSRGLLPPDRAEEARGMTPEEAVSRGWIDQREMELLVQIAGRPLLLFDRYEVLHEVGRGGMGIVYACRDVKLGRDVAVKCLPAGPMADLERFEREARTAARLTHPAIVPLYDFGRGGGQLYLTMELIDGSSLGVLLREGRLERRAAIEVLRQVAGAMEYSHAQGVIHRDLKPDNILVNQGGAAFLTDFGLAKRVEGETALTVSGMLLGTPAFMSPEQARGEAVDARSDLYSLGATLYCVLTGVPPHGGSNPLEVVMAAAGQTPRLPRSVNPQIAPDLQTICLKAMDPEPARRYASAAAFGEDLRRFLAGEPILARPASATYRLRRWIVRHRALSAAAALVLLAAGAALAGRWMDARGRELTRPHLDAGRQWLQQADRYLTQPEWEPIRLAGLLAQARAEFGVVLERFDEDPEALLEMARTYVMMKDGARAHEHYSRAVAAAPDLAAARLERALLLTGPYERMRHSREGKTLDPSDRSLAVLAEIRADLEAVRKSSGDAAELLLAAGVLTFLEVGPEAAEPIFRQYVGTRDADPRGWEWLGHTLFHLDGRREEAAVALTKALGYRPRDVDLLYMRASAWSELERWKEAAQEMDVAIATEPGDAQFYLLRARCRHGLKDHPGALADADAAIARRPTGEAHYARADYREHVGELKGAVEDFGEAMRLEYRVAGAVERRGKLRRKLKDLPGALEDFARLAELRPKDPDPWVRQGEVREEMGRGAEAAAAYRAALERAPADWPRREEIRRRAGEKP